MFTNLFCHAASTVRENSAGFFVIANYYLLNIFIYGTNYFKSQIIIVGDIGLSLTTISLSVFILHLYRRINTLCDYYNCMYGYINMINKAQEENHKVMLKTVAVSKEVNDFNAKLIKENKVLYEYLKEKSK